MNAVPWLLTVLFAALWWRTRRAPAGRRPARAAPRIPVASPVLSEHPAPPERAAQGPPPTPALDIEAADPRDERLLPRRRWVWAGVGLLAVFVGVTVLSSAYNDIPVTPLPDAQSGQGTPDAPAELLVLGGANPARAPALFRNYGCGACHVVPGVPGAAGRVGPNLAHLHDHALIAGVLPNTSENLVRWIRVPQNVDPYTGMPNLGVTERDARDLAAYLQALP